MTLTVCPRSNRNCLVGTWQRTLSTNAAPPARHDHSDIRLFRRLCERQLPRRRQGARAWPGRAGDLGSEFVSGVVSFGGGGCGAYRKAGRLRLGGVSSSTPLPALAQRSNKESPSTQLRANGSSVGPQADARRLSSCSSPGRPASPRSQIRLTASPPVPGRHCPSCAARAHQSSAWDRRFGACSPCPASRSGEHRARRSSVMSGCHPDRYEKDESLSRGGFCSERDTPL